MYSSSVAFKMESKEFHEELGLLLLKLEKNPNFPKAAVRIYQNFHAIKGLSSLFGLRDLTEFIQHLEKLFYSVSQYSISLTPNLIETAIKAYDHIESIAAAQDEETVQGTRNKSAELLKELNRLTGASGNTEKPSPRKAAAVPSGKKTNARRSRILIVDDDEINRTILEGYVKNTGSNFDIVSVSSGEEAIYLFLTREFDLVLLDIMMPVMDGNMFINIVEKNIQAGNLSKIANIVVQTAVSSMAELLAITKRECVQEVIRKPLQYERVRDCIERYC